MFSNRFLKMLNREASSPKMGADKIIANLPLSEGTAVADIGSGGGFFTFAFARKVGMSGTVFAVDTNPKYLDFIKNQALEEGLSNIEYIIAEENRTNLPESSLDLIFARNVFHHLSDPEDYFRGLKQALKPSGKIAIIDHGPGKGFNFVNLFKHFTPVEKIINTMESAGYSLYESFDFLPSQSFTIYSLADR